MEEEEVNDCCGGNHEWEEEVEGKESCKSGIVY